MSRIYNIIQNPLQLLYILPAIIIGMTVHEWAHAYVAYRLGDPTAKNLGRMTLNPLAHFDVFGFLCLLLIGFGCAKPVPVNSRNFKNFRRDDILVSLAGITMNLLVAFVFSFIYILGYVKWGLADNEAFLSIFGGIVTINLALAMFNLIPIYPLDGSHVLEALLIRKFPRFFMFMRQYGQIILILLLITGAATSALSFLVSGVANAFLSAAGWIINLF